MFWPSSAAMCAACPSGTGGALLEELAEGFEPPLQLSPATTDPTVAQQWWDDLAQAGVEGLVSKPLSAPYKGGERSWQKAKRRESTDVIVGAVIGPLSHPSQLVLGLPDEEGQLRIVGRTAPLGAVQSRQAAALLRPPVAGHPWPEEVPAARIDRFARDRGTVRLTLVQPIVAEISADTARSHGAFRHSVRLVRLRDDVDSRSIPHGF